MSNGRHVVDLAKVGAGTVKRAGQIVLTTFPYTDLSGAKLRPVLMPRQASRFDDWLVCMVSSKLDQTDGGFDEVLTSGDADFVLSGLRVTSALRLSRILQRLAQWIAEAD